MVGGSMLIMHGLYAKNKGKVYGYNNMLYTLDTNWSKANPTQYPVNDCHEMVQDKHGRILLLTNETKNNILIYNTKGKFLETWDMSFPAATALRCIMKMVRNIYTLRISLSTRYIKPPWMEKYY
jgi:hypothetical protein